MDAGVQASTQARSIVGVISSDAAEQLLGDLQRLGLGPDELSVMTRDTGPAVPPVAETQASAISGSAATGAAFGGLLGGLAGWMVSIGAIAIPGILVPGVGSIFAAGVLAATLTGLAVGAAAGGLVGALLGLGVPEEEARQYQDFLRKGSTLVTVHPPSGADKASIMDIFQAHGAHDVRTYEVPEPISSTPDSMPEHDEQAPGQISDVSPVAEAAPASPGIISRVHRVSPPATDASLAPGNTSPEGKLSAETSDLGSGAEGGYGDGDARDEADVLGDTPESELEQFHSVAPPATETATAPARVDTNAEQDETLR